MALDSCFAAELDSSLLPNNSLCDKFSASNDLFFLTKVDMGTISLACKSQFTNSKLVIVVILAVMIGIILVEKKGESGSIILVILKLSMPPS